MSRNSPLPGVQHARPPATSHQLRFPKRPSRKAGHNALLSSSTLSGNEHNKGFKAVPTTVGAPVQQVSRQQVPAWPDLR